jgi:hypothetical protein
VEEFVREVKGWQWLALRMRFLEEVPEEVGSYLKEEEDGKGETRSKSSWVEREKIGEVLDDMRTRGRERWFIELGIGS